MSDKIYIGTKIIAAEPMNDLEFAKRHVGHPRLNLLTVNPNPGYRVRYEDGYVSWSPKDVFERCYRELSGNERKLILFSGGQRPSEATEELKTNRIGDPKGAASVPYCGNCGKRMDIDPSKGGCDCPRGYKKMTTTWVYVFKSAVTGDHYIEVRPRAISGDIIKTQNPMDTYIAGPTKIEYEAKL